MPETSIVIRTFNEALFLADLLEGIRSQTYQDYEIMTSPDVFHTVLGEVERKGIQPSTAEISMVPQNFVKLEGKVAQQMIKLMDGLDDHDDVQNVHANFDIEESELAKAI